MSALWRSTLTRWWWPLILNRSQFPWSSRRLTLRTKPTWIRSRRILISRSSLTRSTSQDWSQTSSLWTARIWRSWDHSTQSAWARSRSAPVRRSNFGLQPPASLLTLSTRWPFFKCKSRLVASAQGQSNLGSQMRWIVLQARPRISPFTWRSSTRKHSTTFIVSQLSTNRSPQTQERIRCSWKGHSSGASKSMWTNLLSTIL